MGSPFWKFWSSWRADPCAVAAGTFDDACRRAENFHAAMMLRHERQTIFLTTTGHMGISNHMVQEDDVVALFAGCEFPMVIRRFQADGEHYRLISSSYVNGIMQGEAWPGDVPFKEMK